jgi:hypothetical protein
MNDVAYCIVQVFRFATTEPWAWEECPTIESRVIRGNDPFIAKLACVSEAKAKQGLDCGAFQTKPRRSFLLKPLMNDDRQRKTK